MADDQTDIGKRAKPKRKSKQAVIVIHGMGEQVPMQTLRDFVDTTWVTDDDLISRGRPDTNTGVSPRTTNPVWSKPDERNRSYELRRITTELPDGGRRTDFYEFYWAHLMHGTTWEHFKAWMVDLLWRSPKRVPRDVFSAWIALWIVTVIVAAVVLYALLPVEDLRQCWAGKCDEAACDAKGLCWTWVAPVLGALFSLGVGSFVNVFLLKYFGDVARYVKATPLNVARRQEIRDKGVELLDTLMGVDGFDFDSHPDDEPLPEFETEYDRIIVVAHSLGTIVAYDILKHSFARVHRFLNADPDARQPNRHRLESLLQDTIAQSGTLDIDAYRELQTACLEELQAEGNPWIVSDFVTLGCPLTHAEFLLAYDAADMRTQQEQRILPTCPPMLEFDRKTGGRHFSFWPLKRRTGDKAEEGEFFRFPHHAAHFAYTRWTNIYSRSKGILWGDLISGPLAGHFDLTAPGATLRGILDIAVLPERDAGGKAKGSVPFFTHTKYWNREVRTGPNDNEPVPFHIERLREAIKLIDR